MSRELPHADRYQEMREALRGLTAHFDSAYWQQGRSTRAAIRTNSSTR